MKNNRNGFTLVELIVVMAVFLVVLMIAGDAFKTILQQTAKLFRSEEGNIEGVVGLEMFRHDLQQGGYGLFTHDSPVEYSEASIDLAKPYNNEPNSTNATKVPPKAFAFGDNLAAGTDGDSESGNAYNIVANSDYIAIKATTVGRSNSSQKWTYLKYDSGSVAPHTWVSDAENFETDEKVVLMARVSSAKGLRIVKETTNPWFYFPYGSAAFNNTAFANYSTTVSSSFVLYGLDDKDSTPRMPFNRTDYFVGIPTNGAVPPVCAKGAGILYKTIVNNSTAASTGGKFTYFPILDCVLDMQVILGWDLFAGPEAIPGNDGNLDVWTNADATRGSTANSSNQYISGDAALSEAKAAFADPARLRNSLKIIKVYILAQSGRFDSNFTSPNPIVVGNTKYDGTDPQGLGHSYTLQPNMLKYRWKVYQIIVRPKNLTTNQ